MKQLHILFLSMICIMTSTAMNSCTIIGGQIGAYFDRYSQDTTADFSRPIFKDIEENRGRLARIVSNDSSISYAIFEDFSEETYRSYDFRFRSFSDNHGGFKSPFLPADLIALIDAWGGTHKAYFIGFSPHLYSGIVSADFLENFGIDNMYRLTSSSSALKNETPKKISTKELRFLIEENHVPVRSTLWFIDKEKSFTLTNSDFQQVTISHNKNGAIIGTVIGLMIDAAITVTLINRGFFNRQPQNGGDFKIGGQI